MADEITKTGDDFIVIRDAEHNHYYRTGHTIGTAKGTPVYEACLIPADPSVNGAFDVAVKWVNINQEAEYEIAKQEVQRYNLFSHPNILGIKTCFYYNKGFYTIMPNREVASIRSIMMTNFKNGLPEDCIAVVLRESLMGLCEIHKIGEIHREINGGNIFFHDRGAIQLAFAASIYERNAELGQASSSTHLPASLISSWAAAPEVYDSDNVYTSKADIWLIGITALELANGGVWVSNREELDAMVAEVRDRRRLPNNGGTVKSQIYEELKRREKEREKKKGIDFMGFLKEKIKGKKEKGKEVLGSLKERVKGKKVLSFFKEKVESWRKTGEPKERYFSKHFEKMVARCLAEKLKKRPTAKKLLQHKFFKNCKNVNYFANVVVRRN